LPQQPIGIRRLAAQQRRVHCDVIIPVAAVDDQRRQPVAAAGNRAERDRVTAGTAVDGERRCRRGTRLAAERNCVGSDARVDGNRADMANQIVQRVSVVVRRAVDNQRIHVVGREELGLQAGAHHDNVSATASSGCSIVRGIQLRSDGVPCGGVAFVGTGVQIPFVDHAGHPFSGGVQGRIDRYDVDGVVLSVGLVDVVEVPQLQRIRTCVQPGNISGRLVDALPIEAGDHLVHKPLAVFVQGDFPDADVEPDPQEGFQEDAQLARNIEQALRPMLDPFEQFAAVQFAVAQQVPCVLIVGKLVVQVEADHRFDPAGDARLDQAADAQRGYRGHGRRQRRFGQVFVRVLPAVVVHVEAVEDPPALCQGKVVLLPPLPQAAGVEAEIEVRGGADRALEAHVQPREDRIGFLVHELQVQVRQVVPEQIHFALAGQEVQDRRRVLQHRNAEPRPTGTAAAARGQSLLVGTGQQARCVQFRVVRRRPRHVLGRRCCTAVSDEVPGEIEIAKADRAGVGEVPRGFQEIQRGVQDLDHFLGRIDGTGRQRQVGQIDELDLADPQIDLLVQQVDQRLQRLDDVVDRVERVAQKAAHEAAHVQRHVFQPHLRRAGVEAGAAAGGKAHVGQHLVVMDDGRDRRQNVAERGVERGTQVDVHIGRGVQRQDHGLAGGQFPVPARVRDIDPQVAPDAAAE